MEITRGWDTIKTYDKYDWGEIQKKHTRDDADKLLLHLVDEMQRIENKTESRLKGKEYCIVRRFKKNQSREIFYQRGNNPEEYAEEGIICRINLFSVEKYRQRKVWFVDSEEW